MPPYLRDVVPSACWKASKISDSLSVGDADAGVGDRNAITRRPSSASLSAVGRRPIVQRHRRPSSVNLNALESRLRSTCCSRCSSVTIGGGQRRGRARRGTRAPSARPPAGTRARRPRRRRRGPPAPRSTLHPAGLDLGQVEDVVDQREQVGAGARGSCWANSICWSVQVAVARCRPAAGTGSAASSAACAARGSCWPGTRTCTASDSASCAAFSSRPRAGELDLARS